MQTIEKITKNYPEYENFRALLTQKTYKNRDVPSITPKMVAHWLKESVIQPMQKEAFAKIEFSSSDILWMSMILDLRHFGCSYDTIRKIKAGVFEAPKSFKDEDATFFEYALIETIVSETLMWIIIDENWKAIYCDVSDYSQYIKEHPESNYLVISINKIIKENLQDFYTTPTFRDFLSLSPEEMEVLAIVRSTRYDYVKITKKSGEIDLIEGVQRVESTNKISDLLKMGLYQDIEIKQYNGHISTITRTVRKKVGK